MPHWRSLLERDAIGAWDLVEPKTGKPRDYNVEIARVDQVKVYSKDAGGVKGKGRIYFRGVRKYLVAGTTLLESIAGIYGDDIATWPGKFVTLYPTTTRVGKDPRVPCVRIRPTGPTGRIAEVPPDNEPNPEMRAAQNEAFGREPGEEG